MKYGFSFTITIDHSQFYVEDGTLPAEADVWTDRALADHISTAPGLIAVLIGRFGGDTRIAVEISETRPDESFEPWDQVVECAIHLPSGSLTIYAPETTGLPENPRITVPPGSYRALVYWGGLDSIPDETGYEGDDHYKIALWPGEVIQPIIHKRYNWPEEEVPELEPNNDGREGGERSVAVPGLPDDPRVVELTRVLWRHFSKHVDEPLGEVDFTIEELMHFAGDARSALLYSSFFCPPLVEIDGMVFHRLTMQNVPLEEFVEMIREGLEGPGQTRKKLEREFNSVQVQGAFYPNGANLTLEEELLLADVLAESWRAWIHWRYPGRRFVIKTSKAKRKGDESFISFYQE